MAVIGWDDIPDRGDENPWDVVYLGDDKLPGVWDVNLSAHKNLDVKSARKKDGAKVKDQGTDPVRVVLTGTILSEHWGDMSRILKKIRPIAGRPRGAFTITHPKCVPFDVKAIEIEDVNSPDLIGRNGIAEISIYGLEWVPDTKKTKELSADDQWSAWQADIAKASNLTDWQRAKSPWFTQPPPNVDVELDRLLDEDKAPDFVFFPAP